MEYPQTLVFALIVDLAGKIVGIKPGKHYAKVLLAALLLFTHPAHPEQDTQKTFDDDTQHDYALVWADEFDQETCPDPRHWVYEQDFIRNRELQWYQQENAFCKDGMLVIEARRERKDNPDFVVDSARWQESRRFAEYTSASLKTQGLWSWRYGRFEIRARIPVDSGLWPVFWTLGKTGQWPASGEIDIFESYRGLLLANAAWGGDRDGRPGWSISQRPVAGFGNNWTEAFHLWRMDWSEAFIRLYVDGRLLNAIDLRSTENAAGLEPENPFHHPHFLVLSLAVGGRKGGDPSRTNFPANLEVDYIRVYQRLLLPRSAPGDHPEPR